MGSGVGESLVKKKPASAPGAISLEQNGGNISPIELSDGSEGCNLPTMAIGSCSIHSSNTRSLKLVLEVLRALRPLPIYFYILCIPFGHSYLSLHHRIWIWQSHLSPVRLTLSAPEPRDLYLLVANAIRNKISQDPLVIIGAILSSE